MYTIQANPSGTRNLEISEENLATIEKYGLFRHLIDSNGIVDETVLDKLKLNIRSLIAAQEEDSKDLLDLFIDVIYHNNMKAFSPLIPAIKAMCEAGKGEKLEIIMDDATAFNDLKEYLAEQGIGFREIYDGEEMLVQFCK